MYCTKCGKQIEDGSKFREFCGASLTNDSQRTQGVQSAPPYVPPNMPPPNVPPIMQQGIPSAPTHSKINDEGIKALITQHRGYAEADTPYFYAYTQNLLIVLLSKYFILNFTQQGLHIYTLGVSTNIKVKDYLFVPISDIKSVKMKKGLIQWNVNIHYLLNGKLKKMKVKVSKKVIGIKEQVPNLERVKQMFNQ